jgi:hypothetical protein
VARTAAGHCRLRPSTAYRSQAPPAKEVGSKLSARVPVASVSTTQLGASPRRSIRLPVGGIGSAVGQDPIEGALG